MTVPSTPRRAGPFLGNGVTTSFPFTFKTFAAADLQLTKTGTTGLESVLVLGSDYSVTLNPDQDISPGGTITYPITGSPLASGEKLTLLGDVDYDQTTDLLGGGAFNARVIEDTFDRVVIQIQQLDERVDRALIMSAGTTASGLLPDVATRADKLLAFDASGNPTVVVPPTGTAAALQVDLASTAAGKGAAMVGFLQTGAGAVARTVLSRLRDTVSVKDFGAVGDGVADDTVAIQAAIDAFKATDAYDPEKTVNIFFPMGNYRVTSSLAVYSGTRLIGEGNRSKITAAAALTTQIIELKRTPAIDSLNFVVIENLGFYTRGTCWAIKATAATVTEVYLRNLYFDCTFCVDSSTYTQSCEYSSLYSTGPVEQVLLFAGNMNTIRNLVVEGTAGTSTAPTVRFKGHVAGKTTNNIVDRILIENTGSVNKVPLRIEDSDHLVIAGYWMEVGTTNGNSVEIVNCNSIRFTNFYRGIQTGSKVSIATTKDVWFDVVDTDAQSQPLASFFTIDATSRVRISRIYCRDAQGIYPKSLIAKNVVIDHVYNRTSPTVTGYQAVSQLSYRGGNLFVNPSFEAGIYGWDTSSMGAYTGAYSGSDVANGLMARFTWGSAAVAYLYQNITISAGQVGMPITFTAWVKNSSGVGWIAPLSFGTGISATSGINYTSGTDWQLITSTVVPQSAGTLSIGFYFEGTTDVYVDEASVYFGTVSQPNTSEFGSVQITGKPVLFATAAPTTGTWVVGSKVFNSAPATGAPKGWICTVAGTPGTWVSEGNL